MRIIVVISAALPAESALPVDDEFAAADRHRVCGSAAAVLGLVRHLGRVASLMGPSRVLLSPGTCGDLQVEVRSHSAGAASLRCAWAAGRQSAGRLLRLRGRSGPASIRHGGGSGTLASARISSQMAGREHYSQAQVMTAARPPSRQYTLPRRVHRDSAGGAPAVRRSRDDRRASCRLRPVSRSCSTPCLFGR